MSVAKSFLKWLTSREQPIRKASASVSQSVRLAIEQLENRELMSATGMTFHVQGKTLAITGTEKSDQVIVQNLESGGIHVVMTTDNQTREVDFAKNRINLVRFDAKTGDDAFENETMLACVVRETPAVGYAAALSRGVLKIAGTGKADTITIQQDENMIRVISDNGQFHLEETLAASAVKSISINGKGGNDTIDMGHSYIGNMQITANGFVTSLSNGKLKVTGTNQADDIQVRQVGGSLQIIASHGSSIDVMIAAAPLNQIIVNGGLGNDVIDLGGNAGGVQVPVTLLGGPGNDSLFGGTGSNMLIGGAGSDLLSGAFGTNRMYGGSGNDIFIDPQVSDQVFGGAGKNQVVISDQAVAKPFGFSFSNPSDWSVPDSWSDVERATRPQDLPGYAGKLYRDIFGATGRVAYPAAAGDMEISATVRGVPERTLEHLDLQLFRQMFGDWVDGVRVFYGVPPLANIGEIPISNTEAMTFGYKIYISHPFDAMRTVDRIMLIAHELVHVRQYREADESLQKFGERYFRGYAENLSYEQIPMEVEAYSFVADHANTIQIYVQATYSEFLAAQRLMNSDGTTLLETLKLMSIDTGAAVLGWFDDKTLDAAIDAMVGAGDEWVNHLVQMFEQQSRLQFIQTMQKISISHQAMILPYFNGAVTNAYVDDMPVTTLAGVLGMVDDATREAALGRMTLTKRADVKITMTRDHFGSLALTLQANGADFAGIARTLWTTTDADFGDIARALQNAANADFGDIARALQQATNADFGDIARALQQATNADFGDIARALQAGAHADFDSIAKALKAGAHADFCDIARALQNGAHADFGDIARTLETSVGADFGDIARALQTGTHADFGDIARTLRASVGADFGDIAQALKTGTSADFADIARALKAGAGADFGGIAWALQAGAGADFSSIAWALQVGAHADFGDIATTLQASVGADFGDIARALKTGTSADFADIARALKAGAGADFGGIAWALQAGAGADFSNIAWALQAGAHADFGDISRAMDQRTTADLGDIASALKTGAGADAGDVVMSFWAAITHDGSAIARAIMGSFGFGNSTASKLVDNLI